MRINKIPLINTSLYNTYHDIETATIRRKLSPFKHRSTVFVQPEVTGYAESRIPSTSIRHQIHIQVQYIVGSTSVNQYLTKINYIITPVSLLGRQNESKHSSLHSKNFLKYHSKNLDVHVHFFTLPLQEDYTRNPDINVHLYFKVCILYFRTFVFQSLHFAFVFQSSNVK